jgi:hypothetical protein
MVYIYQPLHYTCIYTFTLYLYIIHALVQRVQQLLVPVAVSWNDVLEMRMSGVRCISEGQVHPTMLSGNVSEVIKQSRITKFVAVRLVARTRAPCQGDTGRQDKTLVAVCVHVVFARVCGSIWCKFFVNPMLEFFKEMHVY